MGKEQSERIKDLIKIVKSCIKEVSTFQIANSNYTSELDEKELYDEIHEWMNVGLSSLALTPNESDRLIDKIQIKMGELRPADPPFDTREKGALRYLLMKYTRTEQTMWHHLNELNSGYKLGNTRILETEWKGEPRLSVYNGYMEFNRVANYHGYWDRKQARALINYLERWLHKTTPKIEDTEFKSDSPTLEEYIIRRFGLQVTVLPSTDKQEHK